MGIPEIFRRQLKHILMLLSLFVVGWGFTDYQTVFAGLILGTSLSLYNLWILARRTQKFGDSVVEGRKVRSLGSLSRLAVAALAVIISTGYPEHFHLLSTVLGLMTSYIVIMIDFFIQSIYIRR